LIHDGYDVDIGPLKLKTFRLGPSIENIGDGPAIVCALWHPLGVHGRCLVTISDDSVLRLWELNREDRSSFDESALSIDLIRLLNAKDEDANLRASRYQSGKAFTPDYAYIEPVSACFGGLGRNGENPWSSMTLWIAMTDGDLYALCPILPTKFQGFPGLVSCLSNLLNAKSMEILESSTSSSDDEYHLRQETIWVQDLEGQEPYVSIGSFNTPDVEIFSRPSAPQPKPTLQGPFDFGLDSVQIADILIRNVSVAEEPLQLETGELLLDESDDLDPMAVSVLCLLTREGTLHVLLNTDGVEPRWLPSKTPLSTPKKTALVLSSTEDEPTPLLFLGSINVLKPTNSRSISTGMPMITPDIQSSYSFFITHVAGVSHVSLDSLIELLQAQLLDPVQDGSDFRVDLFLNSAKPTIEHLIKFDKEQKGVNASILTCIVLVDSDLGYFVLTSTSGHPHAVTLDTRYRDTMQESTQSTNQYSSLYQDSFEVSQPRQPYEADDGFYVQSEVPAFLKNLASRSAVSLHENVRLSPETLGILMEAHQLFSKECQNLSEAVARAHIACNTLLSDFQDQIAKVRGVARRIDAVTGNDEEQFADEEGQERGRDRIEARMQRVLERQQKLAAKYKSMQKKLACLSGPNVSLREKEFVNEIESISADLRNKLSDSGPVGKLGLRMQDVKNLCEEVISQTESISKESPSSPSKSDRPPSRAQVPAGLRKSKMNEVMKLLERQNAMVESTVERLSRLKISLDAAGF
jgi:nucleoporin NUP82